MLVTVLRYLTLCVACAGFWVPSAVAQAPSDERLRDSVAAQMRTARGLAADRDSGAAFRAMLDYSVLRDSQLVREQRDALVAQRRALEAEAKARGMYWQRIMLVVCTLIALLLGVAVAGLLRGRRLRERSNRLLATERDANRALAQEREILIREVHHRVKGNLQIVTSLLNLQIRSLRSSPADEATVEALRQTRWRVEAIALAHQQLQQSESLEAIAADDYLERLVEALSVGAGGTGIEVEVRAEPVAFSAATAVTVGLVVAELVGNVYKHAFPGRSDGRALVGLAQTAPGRARLVVEDEGCGLPPGADQSPTLGMRLVRDLATQVDGDLEWSPLPGGGTRAVLEFVLPQA